MAIPTRPETWPRRVVHEPRILGGEPTLEGTRVPVRSVVLAVRFGASSHEVLEAFPMLDGTAVNLALDYYRRHSAEIDRYIAENDDPPE